MQSTRWLVAVVLLWSAVASAQVAFSPTEEQEVQLTLSEIQQVIQQARADKLEMPLDSFLVLCCVRSCLSARLAWWKV